MKLYFSLGIFLVAALVASLLGYGVYLNQRGEHQITERMEHNRLPLTGARAERRDILPLIEMELVNLYSDEMTDVVALTNGRIADAFVERNSHVEAGAPIIVLADEDIALKLRQAESDILEAEAQLIRTRNSYERYRQLRAADAVSAEKFDEAEALYKAAEARRANYQAQKEQLLVQQARQTVTSPIAGEVLTLYQKRGAYVTAGTAVALVGDFRHLRFAMPVQERHADSLRLGMEAELSFYGNEAMQKSYGAEYREGNRGNSQVFVARVARISPDVSEDASVREALWELDNGTGILEPGVYSRVRLRLRDAKRCLAVPLAALTSDSRTAVAVVDAEGTLRLRHVETGVDDGSYVEVISGLAEGDVVITSDTAGLKEGTPVDVAVEEGSGA